jgi:hypothetical protein
MLVRSDEHQLKHFWGGCKDVVGGTLCGKLIDPIASATSIVRGAS